MQIKEFQKVLSSKVDQEYDSLTPHSLKLFEKYILPSWWVVFFLLLCYMAYEKGVYKVNREYSKLHQQLEQLQQEKIKALAIQEDYILQVNSQSDHDWVELTLMKGLDLVPEDQVKVFFTEEK